MLVAMDKFYILISDILSRFRLRRTVSQLREITDLERTEDRTDLYIYTSDGTTVVRKYPVRDQKAIQIQYKIEDQILNINIQK